MKNIKEDLEEYINLRQSLGYKLDRYRSLLNDFLSFLKKHDSPYITTRLALIWAQSSKNTKPSYWAHRLSMVRGFARHRCASDPRTEIPPSKLMPIHFQRSTPYIYREDQIVQIIEAAKTLPSATGMRASTYSTLFGLMSVTGLRTKEMVTLNIEDVDLNQGTLRVCLTKFGKTRIVPLHPSTQYELKRYSFFRDQIFPSPKSPSFFVSESGKRLTTDMVRWTFIRMSRQIGLRKPDDSHGPRLHDLRHTIAVKIIMNWYRAGKQVEQQMPRLATFLGHTHISNTYWYLSATPELLSLACNRLEHPKGELS